MADAKKCDRCGRYYQEVEPTALDSLAQAMSPLLVPGHVYAKRSIIEKFLDLCPSCSKSLEKWLKGKEG